MSSTHRLARVGPAAAAVAVCAVVGWAVPARGVVYLADTALEKMIVQSTAIVIGKATKIDAAGATIAVGATLKGDKKDTLELQWRTKGPRLEEGKRVLLFMTANDGALQLRVKMPIRTDAEEKTIAGCFAEIEPHAALLNDLADESKPVDAAKVTATVGELAKSKNAFTQIIVGRLMEGPLAKRVDAAGGSDAIRAGLASVHEEFIRGAVAWAEKSKDATLIEPLRAAKARTKNDATKRRADMAIASISYRNRPTTPADTQPETRP